jgi:DNA-directed RNA polymerase specialized sigma24 family protein
MFQTALLLSGDREVAERALIDSIDDVLIDECIDESTVFSLWRDAVLAKSISDHRAALTGTEHAVDRGEIDPRFRSIMRIRRLPRLAFILRLLVGYPFKRIATLLDVSEEAALDLVLQAASQLLEDGR